MVAKKAPTTITIGGGLLKIKAAILAISRQTTRQAMLPSTVLSQSLMRPLQAPTIEAAGSPKDRKRMARNAISLGNNIAVARLPIKK